MHMTLLHVVSCMTSPLSEPTLPFVPDSFRETRPPVCHLCCTVYVIFIRFLNQPSSKCRHMRMGQIETKS